MEDEPPTRSSRMTWLWISLSAVLAVATFVGGVFVGNSYRITDFLCPATATPQRLTVDLVSEDGVRLPAGTMVALRKCAYMQRFHMEFAADKAVEFDPVPEGEGQETTFRILHPVD